MPDDEVKKGKDFSSSPPSVSHSETSVQKFRLERRRVESLSSENFEDRVRVFFNEGTGFYEMIDVLTGDLVACENKVEGPWDLKSMNEVEIDGRKVLVPVGADYSRLISSKRFHLTPELIQLMCNEITAGSTVTQVCSQAHFPSTSVLGVWRKEYPWVNDALEHAFKMRAELARDKVQQISEDDAMSKMELENQKKAMDGWKWLASKDDAGRFGNKKDNLEVGGDVVINIISKIDRGESREREVVDVKGEQVQVIGEKSDNIGGDS